MDPKSRREVDSDSGEDEEFEQGTSTCLFCPHTSEGISAMLLHFIEAHSINMLSIRYKLRMDDYAWIQLVNYTRKTQTSPEKLLTLVESKDYPWNETAFYKPVLEDDVLLQWEPDEASMMAVVGNGEAMGASVSLLEQDRIRVAEERAKVAEEALERALTDLKAIREQSAAFLLGDERVATTGLKKSQSEESLDGDDSDPYFISYANVSIHREMLQDAVRTDSYRDFILGNPDVFKDKVVLDVGCGTGILSMFAARAGARKVYAVDRSDIVYQAMAIVRENNLENVITVLRGQVEDVKLEGQVDIIISEWMGYFLLYEAMFDSVLAARDKWLAPNGNVFPGTFTMHLIGLDDESLMSKLDYWKDVYGFSMSTMRSSDLLEAEVIHVGADTIATTVSKFMTFDAQTCAASKLEFDSSFSMQCTRATTITALASYFDTHFATSSEQKQVMFSCSPAATSTHWKQTVFVLQNPLQVKEGFSINGDISVKKQKRHLRALHVELSVRLVSDSGEEVACQVQEYVVQ